ncbi:hypothetical protein L596_008524 [Steinernema carpocapsae]|uniref:Uncharacterized protein n=1 Tax=Steinernema carpocapsae TaxID=34508 RepID=A0A4U5PD98_STECR|nr:hypothetical protein L596_008524 [Steinernema carpocapsae]
MTSIGRTEAKCQMAEEKIHVTYEEAKAKMTNARRRLAAVLESVHRVAELEMQQHEAEKAYEEVSTELEAALKDSEKRIDEDLAKIEHQKEVISKLAKLVQQPWSTTPNEVAKLEPTFIEKLKKDFERMEEVTKLLNEAV